MAEPHSNSDSPIRLPRSPRQNVDAIIPLADLDQLTADQGFWEAQEKTNDELRPKGLYVTHLFRADQVFLRRDWERHLVPVTHPPTRWLRLFRPATPDLILTKMMRGDDPQDMADIAFLIPMIASPQRMSKARLPKLSSPIWSSCVTRSSARNRWCVSWRASLDPQRETRTSTSLTIQCAASLRNSSETSGSNSSAAFSSFGFHLAFSPLRSPTTTARASMGARRSSFGINLGFCFSKVSARSRA